MLACAVLIFAVIPQILLFRVVYVLRVVANFIMLC